MLFLLGTDIQIQMPVAKGTGQVGFLKEKQRDKREDVHIVEELYIIGSL